MLPLIPVHQMLRPLPVLPIVQPVKQKGRQGRKDHSAEQQNLVVFIDPAGQSHRSASYRRPRRCVPCGFL